MEKKSFYERLAIASESIGVITKDSINPHFKSRYADINSFLAEVKKPLLKNGIILLQPIVDNRIVTILQDCYSEAKIESALDLPTGVKAQEMGSYITYYRRYTLQSLLALEADDDDGNDANGHKPQAQPQPQAQAKQKEWLNPNTEKWNKALESLRNGLVTIEQIKSKYSISKENEAKLINESK